MTSYRTLDRRYLHLLMPLIVEQIVMMLVGNINVYLMSRIGDKAVSVINVSDQIIGIGTMMMGIISLGSTILMLNNSGKEDREKFEAILRDAMWLNIALAVIVFLVLWWLGKPILSVMQVSGDLSEIAYAYLRIMSLSLLFQGIVESLSVVFRSFDRVNIAMAVSLASGVLSIVSNSIVITWMSTDGFRAILGIAFATVLVKMITACLAVALVRKLLPVNITLWGERKSNTDRYFKQILHLGIPSGMENVIYNFIQVVITGLIASIGYFAVTSKVYTDSITSIVFTLSVAGGQALQIIISSIFRESYDKARDYGSRIVKAWFTLALLLSLVVAFLSPIIVPIFTQDNNIIQIVSSLLWISVLYTALRAWNEVLVAILQITGDTRLPVVAGVLVKVLVTIPLGWIASRYLESIQAIFWAFTLDEAIRAVWFYRRWMTKKWLKKVEDVKG